jgi:hypothetical protein
MRSERPGMEPDLARALAESARMIGRDEEPGAKLAAIAQYLVRVSSHTNIKLREVAEQPVANQVHHLPIAYAFETAANEVSA